MVNAKFFFFILLSDNWKLLGVLTEAHSWPCEPPSSGGPVLKQDKEWLDPIVTLESNICLHQLTANPIINVLSRVLY